MTQKLIRNLETLAKNTKLMRAAAISELRAMDIVDLTKLEAVQNRVAHKVHSYPSDLSIPRLVELLKLKYKLGL
jgi:hypothetical protein